MSCRRKAVIEPRGARTNVSNQPPCLRGRGIVVAEPKGQQIRYKTAAPHIAAALTALVDVILAVDRSVPCIGLRRTVPGCCDIEGAMRWATSAAVMTSQADRRKGSVVCAWSRSVSCQRLAAVATSWSSALTSSVNDGPRYRLAP